MLKNILEFNVKRKDGSEKKVAVEVKKIGLGRNCSRDIEGTRKHLDEKRAHGYQVHGNPNVCRKSRYLLTNEKAIEVQGPQTSGEVEYVAIMHEGKILISVGSDHNDRPLTTMQNESLGSVYDTAKTKQMAPAVVAQEAWEYDEIKDHWDILNLKSYVTISGRRIPYQDFTLGKLVNLEYHLKTTPWVRENGVVLFGGSMATLTTVPGNVFQFQDSIKGLIFPGDFNFEIHDPILKRTIAHSYEVMAVEEAGSLSL